MEAETLAQRIARVRERIAAAARRAGRDPDSVRLIAVSKTHPASLIRQAIAAGISDLGENRIQEATPKIEALRDTAARWHLIGHVQRNKARAAAQHFAMLHTLDSLRLAETLERQAATHAPAPLPVLLQVNVSGEASKEGFALPGGADNTAQWPDFAAAVERILALPHLRVSGLMTVAPLLPDPAAARPVFRCLRQLQATLAHQFPSADWQRLSMGMTDDFEIAIEEGATDVRIGRALFGARPPA
jgi:hypothetical protein